MAPARVALQMYEFQWQRNENRKFLKCEKRWRNDYAVLGEGLWKPDAERSLHRRHLLFSSRVLFFRFIKNNY